MRSNSPKAGVALDPQRATADYQHQVKNLLAIIRSIAARSANNSVSLADFSSHFDGRLSALARTQKMLARAGAFESDLEELVREELLAHAADRAVVNGPAVLLSQKAAEALGLALHELATNAVKFGALARAGGELAVTWRIDGAVLLLEWRESEVPAVDPQPGHSGFGRDWIEQGLSYQLGAEARLQFLPGGMVCVMRLPLPRVGRVGEP
jgi:two-component system CheB/CheR fusion protein